ncbi:NAD-binding protein [Candidatus Solincola tengchongensis]|uniref:potassium channel family protein n=1 Tax=Candidatus Solincola tengchongensis TaxID=2900693 RepID=UPI002579CCF9|nr:NAD-binding protein [Candidatus Solincola tengchongensis]
MYIVIGGGGKVGSFLAERLIERKHAVAVIEKSERDCQRLARDLNALVIHGDACDYHSQEEAQMSRAHVFAAVTGDDDDNLTACQLARTSFGVPRLVARVNDPANEEIFNLMGIDAISSTTIVARLIESMSTVEDIITLHALRKGKVVVVEVDIPPGGSQACCRRIKEIGLPPGCVLISVVRGEEVIIPRGEDILQPGDSVIAVTAVDKEEELRRLLLT